jgi:uncharacterized protein YfiM (DUF2279 family)
MKRTILTLLLLLITSYSHSQLLTESDKQQHFAAGYVIGAIGYGFILNETGSKPQAMAASIVCALAAGFIKESYDRKHSNGFDHRDLLATTYGGLTVGITLNIFAKSPKKGKSVLNFGFIK